MKFDFYIGGYFHNHSYRLILNGDKLSISDYVGWPSPEHDKVIFVQDNKDWQHLVEFMKGCDWKKCYNSDILDGTQWELKARGGGHQR